MTTEQTLFYYEGGDPEVGCFGMGKSACPGSLYSRERSLNSTHEGARVGAHPYLLLSIHHLSALGDQLFGGLTN